MNVLDKIQTDFSIALKWLKRGVCMTRIEWPEGQAVALIEGSFVDQNCEPLILTHEDILATDWGEYNADLQPSKPVAPVAPVVHAEPPTTTATSESIPEQTLERAQAAGLALSADEAQEKAQEPPLAFIDLLPLDDTPDTE